MRKAFIYKITSKTNKIYIGSTFNIKSRWNLYLKLKCKDQPRLYNSLLKHGIENHKFEVISECNIYDRYKQESYYGNLYNCLGNNGLNCCLPKSEKYYSVSESTKNKLSITSKGRKHSNETLKKMSEWQIGRKLSESTKIKISNSKIGKKLSQDHKLKISQGGIGRIQSIESIQKQKITKLKNKEKGWVYPEYAKKLISESQKGKILSDIHRKKISESNKGKIHSQETRIKMSESAKGLIKSKETCIKISESRKKIILNTINGIFYFGLLEASISVNVNKKTLCWWLSGYGKNKTSLIYV